MKKVFVSPAAQKGKGYSNPFFVHLKKELSRFYRVLDPDNKGVKSQSLALLEASVKADVFVLSFVETIPFHRFGIIQTYVALLSLEMMRLRKKKVVFILHNPKPHNGENAFTNLLTNKLFSVSSLVVTHTSNTAEIARRKGANVLQMNHPVVFPEKGVPSFAENPARDILIWGEILPYKGVAEFLSLEGIQSSGLRIDILGRCKDAALTQTIQRLIAGNDSISWQNRRPDMDEVEQAVGQSRHVLFPYLRGSISGSGLLLDTLLMGGSCIGPDEGAFRELASLGLCRIYHNENELLDILNHDWRVDRQTLESFLRDNSWEQYVNRIQSSISTTSL